MSEPLRLIPLAYSSHKDEDDAFISICETEARDAWVVFYWDDEDATEPLSACRYDDKEVAWRTFILLTMGLKASKEELAGVRH